jgi:phage-related protein
VAAIPQIITSLVNAIVGNIDKIILAGVQLFVALIANLPTIIIEVVKAVPQIIAGLVTAIIESVPELAKAGLDLIKGLWQGISDAGAWLWEKISGFFGNVVSKIKNFFGIKSPSALFAGIGQNMGEGIGVGFEDAMAAVSRDMQNAIPTNFDLNYRGLSGQGSAAGTNITQNLSVVTPKALSEKELAREFKNLSRKLALEY